MGVRAFGVASLVLGTLAYVALEEPLDATLAFGLGVLGLFALLVMGERVVPAKAGEAAMRGAARSLHGVATGLSLEGQATTVPPGGNLQHDRLFVAAGPSVKPLPVMDDATIVYAAPASVRLGLAVEPPGRLLVEEWEEASGQRFRDLPVAGVQAALAGLGLSQGIYARLRVREEGGRFVVSFRPLDVRPPCLDQPPDERPMCERTGCALCSAACVGIARNLQRPVTVTEARPTRAEVTLTLQPEGG